MNQLTGDDYGNLIYLVLLVAVLLFWYMTSARGSMNKMLQQLALWALIFLGVIAAYGMWDDIRSAAMPHQARMNAQGTLEVPRSRDGHYYVTANINGAPTRFVVDTGASGVVLTKAAAEAAGIDLGALAFVGQAQTANGTVNIARTRVDSFGIAGAEIDGFRVMVNEGQMRESLLGMSYLQHFERIEIADGKLVLHP